MKHATPMLTLCASVLLASFPAGAEESPASGLMLTPEQISWKPNPRVPGLSVGKILGDGKELGPYVYRVRFPKGRVVQPHSHPDDRTYTVISGTWYIGWGKTYDESKLTPLTSGSFYTEPAGDPHFISTPDGETVIQVSGTGPTAVHFVDPAHAPKKK